MRFHHFIFLLAFIFLASCTNNYAFEDQLYNCNIEGFNSSNYDLEKNINQIQLLLLEDQILEDTTGSDYDNLFNEMSQGNWDNPKLNPKTTTALLSLLESDGSYWCSLEEMGLDSAQFKSSKFNTIIEDFYKEYPVVNGKHKVFNGKEFATFYGKELSAKDLDHRYYKYLVISGFAKHFVKGS